MPRILHDQDKTPTISLVCKYCGLDAGGIAAGTRPPEHPPYFCRVELDGQWGWCATHRKGWKLWFYADDLFE